MTITEVRLSIPLHASILIRVAEHLGASSRRPRHPFPALMAGETPGRVLVYTALTHPVTPGTATARLDSITLMVMSPYKYTSHFSLRTLGPST